MDTLLGFPIPCDCLDWTFTKANEYLKKQRNKLQPRTKPVETNRENANFFLSSWQKLKPPPNECPISPLPLSKVV